MTRILRIIIVEDNAIIAMDLAAILTAMGHDVCAIAHTETEAVEAATRCEPDLMIVDGSLAQGNGVSAMRQILTRRFVAHVYVTGDPLKLRNLAPDAEIITKPFGMRELTNGMEKALSAAERLAPNH